MDFRKDGKLPGLEEKMYTELEFERIVSRVVSEKRDQCGPQLFTLYDYNVRFLVKGGDDLEIHFNGRDDDCTLSGPNPLPEEMAILVEAIRDGVRGAMKFHDENDERLKTFRKRPIEFVLEVNDGFQESSAYTDGKYDTKRKTRIWGGRIFVEEVRREKATGQTRTRKDELLPLEAREWLNHIHHLLYLPEYDSMDEKMEMTPAGTIVPVNYPMSLT